MSGKPPELPFSVQQADDPLNEWGSLVKELERFDPNILDQWKRDYECWRHQYAKFRQFEQDLLFTATSAGEVPPLDEQLMRFHRRALFALLSSGQRCADLLQDLPLDQEDQVQKNAWSKKIRTLVDSLQESLDIWHRVNAERIETKSA